MEFLTELAKTKIKHVQLDLFGFCNAACWYCPVKYLPQPKRSMVHMPIDLVEKILLNLRNEQHDGLVCPSLNNIYTAHYGEFLLYKHLDEFFFLLEKYKFSTTIFSNGLNLTPDKVDLLYNNLHSVNEIILNIPSFDRKLWAERAGFKESQFDRLIANLEYANEKLSGFKNLIILINGVDNNAWNDSTLPGRDLDSIKIDMHPLRGERFQAYKFAKRKFNNFIVHKEYVLHDRAGLLSNFISNQEYVNDQLKTGKVVGCKGYDDIETDRTTEWLHINSLGETFLCCNDYNMDYVFGNLTQTDLKEIWLTDKHAETILTAREEICRKCYYARIE